MNNYQEILDRHGNGSMKWERAYIKKRFEIDSDDIYPMFIADMDYRMDETIHKKMLTLLKDCDFGYFHVQLSYFEAIVAWYQDVHHTKIKPEWIVPSVGTITTLHFACDCFVKGKGIATFTPIYGSFAGCLKMGTPIYLPLSVDEHGLYQIDFETLETEMKNGHIQALLLCSPHNPGGRVWTKAELKQIVTISKKYGVYLFADEIHSDFTLQGEFTSLIEFADEYDRILVSSSPNKTFNISGLCGSYLVCANEKMRQVITAYMDHLHLGPNRFAIEMTQIVYTYGKERLFELKQIIQNNIDIVKDALKDEDVTIMDVQAGYLMWIKLNKIKAEDVDQFVIDLAKATHVLIERGSRFIDHYDNYIRLNVATSPKIVIEAMKRFKEYYHAR